MAFDPPVGAAAGAATPARAVVRRDASRRARFFARHAPPGQAATRARPFRIALGAVMAAAMRSVGRALRAPSASRLRGDGANGGRWRRCRSYSAPRGRGSACVRLSGHALALRARSRARRRRSRPCRAARWPCMKIILRDRPPCRLIQRRTSSDKYSTAPACPSGWSPGGRRRRASRRRGSRSARARWRKCARAE